MVSSVLKRTAIAVLIGLLLGTSWGLAQPQGKVDLLLVDETQTLQASLLVQIYAKVLQETGLFNFEAKIVNVQSSYDDPLGTNPTDKKYELVLIVPRGIEDGSVPQIWMITRPIHSGARPEIAEALQTIKKMVDQGSGGQFKALGVMEDAALGIFATTFDRNGWLK